MHGRDAFVECGLTPHHTDAATTERQRRDRPKLTKAVLPHDCHLPVGLGSQFVAPFQREIVDRAVLSVPSFLKNLSSHASLPLIAQDELRKSDRQPLYLSSNRSA